MGIIEEGPVISHDESWDIWLLKNLDKLVASEETSSVGASVQQSGNFGQSAAMIDQIIGKVGPMIGRWDPEASSRMIQEF
jgi:hypothetical protein